MKRQNNLDGLKVKYLGPTDTLDSRVKFTQTHNNKSKVFSYDYEFDVLSQACNLLDKHYYVKSYTLINDNTQQRYYFFAVEFENGCYVDLF